MLPAVSGGAVAPADEVEAEVLALHAEVDAVAARLVRLHGDRLACRRGCSGCCTDGLRVFEAEARVIRRRARALLETEAPSPSGCAFLDAEGACRIYAHRPYVCRTQGLPLRWVEADGGERRDVCELSAPRLDLVRLPTSSCHELGPFEGRLATLQARLQGVRPGAALERVALRDLFRPSAPDPEGAGD
jgi:hypothetical protein